MRRSLSVAVAALALLAVGAPAARADEVSSAELRTLAGRAERDPAALAALRRVDRVDGRRADVGRALEGARGAALRDRLAALAGTGTAPAGDARASRAAAREILRDERFRPAAGTGETIFTRIGAWLGAPISWIGDRLESGWIWLQARFGDAAAVVPGGATSVAGLLALAVVAAAALLARRSIGRRALAADPAPTGLKRRERRPDPAELEREADAAEARGELDAAVRLRFRAGLLRLERAGALELRPDLTSGQLARRIAHPAFAELARLFDRTAYGGRPPERGELATFRSGWNRVLAERAAS